MFYHQQHTSDTVIDALKQTFSRNGIPEELVSDMDDNIAQENSKNS